MVTSIVNPKNSNMTVNAQHIWKKRGCTLCGYPTGKLPDGSGRCAKLLIMRSDADCQSKQLHAIPHPALWATFPPGEGFGAYNQPMGSI